MVDNLIINPLKVMASTTLSLTNLNTSSESPLSSFADPKALLPNRQPPGPARTHGGFALACFRRDRFGSRSAAAVPGSDPSID